MKHLSSTEYPCAPPPLTSSLFCLSKVVSFILTNRLWVEQSCHSRPKHFGAGMWSSSPLSPVGTIWKSHVKVEDHTNQSSLDPWVFAYRTAVLGNGQCTLTLYMSKKSRESSRLICYCSKDYPLLTNRESLISQNMERNFIIIGDHSAWTVYQD